MDEKRWRACNAWPLLSLRVACSQGSSLDTGDDRVFDTPYVRAKLPWTTSFSGGARPIGDGLYVAMGGTTTNMTVVDLQNRTQYMGYQGMPGGAVWIYDPYIYVRV
jgi:hypothetical protein